MRCPCDARCRATLRSAMPLRPGHPPIHAQRRKTHVDCAARHVAAEAPPSRARSHAKAIAPDQRLEVALKKARAHRVVDAREHEHHRCERVTSPRSPADWTRIAITVTLVA